MTRYWILFWTFCFLITRAARQKGWNSITVRPAVKLQDIQVIGFNEHIGFHANETWVHVRSSELQLGLREKQCVEARFRVEGKRTRLRVYSCHMEGGGLCIMELYKSVHGATFCHQFYPWFYRPAPYTFHVEIERRPRKFHDKETEMRVRRRRIGRQATREVANFHFVGIKRCSEVCQGSSEEEEFTTQFPIKMHFLFVTLGLSCFCSLISVAFLPGYFKFIAVVVPLLIHAMLGLAVYKGHNVSLHAAFGLTFTIYIMGMLSILIFLVLEVMENRRGSFKLYIVHAASLSGLWTNVLLFLMYGLHKLIRVQQNNYSSFVNEH